MPLFSRTNNGGGEVGVIYRIGEMLRFKADGVVAVINRAALADSLG